MAEKDDIWVFSEKPALLFELVAGARSLADQTGGPVVALVLGPRQVAEEAIARGAGRALWLGELPKEGLVDDYVPTLAEAMKEAGPYALLVGSTRRGRAVAGRLAARFNVTTLTDVLEFSFEGGDLQVNHMIFGGGALRVDQPAARPVIATVAPGKFAARPAEAGRSGEIVDVPFIAPVLRPKLRERKPRPTVKVNLASAKRVVCAGRGLANQADLGMVEELAQALGAEVACSRPLAEGLDWLPRERYIGISGATVHPDLYLGIGVSGQAQHAIGMSESRVVVAINKDTNAPIFSHADYAIPEDLYAVIPALIQALKARK